MLDASVANSQQQGVFMFPLFNMVGLQFIHLEKKENRLTHSEYCT